MSHKRRHRHSVESYFYGLWTGKEKDKVVSGFVTITNGAPMVMIHRAPPKCPGGRKAHRMRKSQKGTTR